MLSARLGTLDSPLGLSKFVEHLRKKYKKSLEAQAEREASVLVNLLKKNTPVDVGFAIGAPGGPKSKRAPYPGHKAVKAGLEDPTGWQYGDIVRVSKDRISIAIFNPTWDLYLKYVNAGYPAPYTAGFVQRAWGEYIRRVKKLGYKS